MNDYDIIIKIVSIPAEDKKEALNKVSKVLDVLNEEELHSLVRVDKQGEWL